MSRLLSAVAAIFLLSIIAAQARQAEAANEDVPMGPVVSPPPRTATKPESSQTPATTGSTDKGKPSQNGGGSGTGGKPAPKK